MPSASSFIRLVGLLTVVLAVSGLVAPTSTAFAAPDGEAAAAPDGEAEAAPDGEAEAAPDDDADGHDDGHGGGGHGDGHAKGSPVDDHNAQLVVWSLITFVIFLIVLKAVAWKPLIEGLDNREANYVKLLGDAEAGRDKALSMLGEYEQKLKAAQAEVDEIIAEARRDAERTKTDIIAAANAEAEATRNRALDDIDRARDQALSSIFEHMHGNVMAATEKVLARSLNDDDHKRLIDEALAEVSAN